MTEKDMEDLISEFPDAFFPRAHFRLAGRQRSFQGVGRFDLAFEDEFNNTILMEHASSGGGRVDCAQPSDSDFDDSGDVVVLAFGKHDRQ